MSIVIPVYNHWEVTEACLESVMVSAESSKLRAEIILADDCSSDETVTEWKRFAGRKWPLRYHRNAKNLRYLRNCNAAFSLCRGEYVCIINNDVVVPEGWLDGLVETMRRTADCGAVGALLLDRYGDVLECGGLVHSDGSAAPLGHGATISDRRFHFLNDVDYVSGACMLVSQQLLIDLGGYDERYAPCYYEDTDLCFRIRERGLRVIVDPRVRVTHYEGTSHGTDVAVGLKRYQVVNAPRFYERWQSRLSIRHPDPFVAPERKQVFRRKGTIVVHYPGPIERNKDSGTLRLWLLLAELCRRGYHVAVVCPWDDPGATGELQSLGIEVVIARHPDEPPCLQLMERAPIAVMFSHWESEEGFGKLYRERCPDAVRLLDTVDLAFLRHARERASRSGVAQIDAFSPGTIDDADFGEVVAALRSDITFVVSDKEAQILTCDLGFNEARVRVVSNIHEPEPTVAPFDARADIAFLGSYNHAPNVDAVLWLVASIWPKIAKALPGVRLKIYGSNVPAKIALLQSEEHRVDVIGFVADHRAALGSARLLIAPLRYGAGVKGKIGEAMAMGTPTVTTWIGAEGMDPVGDTLAIAEEPEGLVRHCVRLYGDRDEWTARSHAGWQLVARKYSCAANVDVLARSITDANSMRNERAYGFEKLVMQALWHTRRDQDEASLVRRAADASLVEHYEFEVSTLRSEKERLEHELVGSVMIRRALLAKIDELSQAPRKGSRATINAVIQLLGARRDRGKGIPLA